jgi:sulfate adenylyltransferase subunit 1 (EFTu-like GTPase family)
MICWMTDEPLRQGARLSIKQTTRNARVIVDELRYRLDVNTLHRDLEATEFGLNDIGRVKLKTSAPLIVDPYRRNRATGSFILIDEATNNTVAGGMILDRENL